MIINHNLGSLNALRQLSTVQVDQQKSLEKLSSGLRINRAGDDAAGLAISEKMRGQISGLEQASRNAQDGISLIQTAEGALNETHSILQRMRELAVQAASDTNTDSDRQAMQQEISQLKSEIDRIANTTQFNSKNLLDGSLSAAQVAQGTKLDSVAVNAKAMLNSAAIAMNGFSIDSTNDTIVLDNGTTQTTVKIAHGSYATGAALATAVQTAIQSAGGQYANVLVSDSSGTLQFDNTNTVGGCANFTIKATSSAGSLMGLNNIDLAVGTALPVPANVAEVANAYNITAANQTLTFNVDGSGPQTITLATGSYTGTALANAINTAIQANSNLAGKVSVSFNAASNQLSFNDTTNNYGSMSTLAISGTFATAVGVPGTTATGATTYLSNLTDVNGNSYGLQAGDVINISANVGKNTVTGSLTISATSTLTDLTNQIASTLGLPSTSVTIDSSGKINITGQNGLANEISNLQLSVNGRTSFNNQFSSFVETQSAQDAKVNNSLTFQIGANQDQTMSVNIDKMDTEGLALTSVNLSTQQGAENAITVIDNAIQKVSSERANLGAFQNRLEHTINNLGTASQNLTAAESRIRDVDMAAEMTNFTKDNILAQAGTAMLAQANQQPQLVLQLLR
jgi:flagellin